MAESALTPARVSPAELVLRLDRLHRGRQPAVVAFDGDGTLWQGDVGIELFQWALERQLLGPEPTAQLREVARAHGLAPEGDSNQLGARLLEAYRSGRLPERTLCELLAWSFAGLALDDVRRLSREALDATGLDQRLNRSLAPIFDWATNRRVRVVIVSASPRFVVEEAARRWDVAPSDIAATSVALDSGRVLPRLAKPVPYGPSKVHFGRELFGDAAWLASFGDSPYDLEMLGAAELGVAVCPKPALLAALPALGRALVLAG